MATQNATTAARTTFTRAEWKALCDLRTRYQQDRDLFSDPERERLRFLRWLCRTGRLMP